MLLLLARLALAQDSRALLDAARYEEALATLEAEYAETADPALLLGKAEAFVGLGRDAEALWCLETWRRQTGGTDQDDRIAALRARVPSEVLADLIAQGLADAEPPPTPAWVPVDASYRVAIAGDVVRVEGTWRFHALREGWLEATLFGPGLVVTEATGPVAVAPSGVRAVLRPGSGDVTVTVRGTLDATPGAAGISVLPAAVQRVAVDAPGLDVTVAGAVDGRLAAADRLDLTWAPHVERTPPPQLPVVVAETSTAAWGEEGALEVRARVRWRVLRGEVGRFVLDLDGLEEAEAEGANLAAQRREGDQLVIETREPVRGAFDVLVRGRAPLREADLPAPRPVDVTRTDRWWTVGKSDEGEIVPVDARGAVPQRALPVWARGLSETAPVASFHSDAPPRLRPMKYEPLLGPDTVVEEADYVVTTSREGRVLLRATWRLRNERRQYLRVRPPDAGWVPLTARVSGQPVSVLSDGAGGVYVPLEKSVETVRGLLDFPVEVTWVATGEAWAKKGERTLRLPSVDAPIQRATWELHLPRGVSSPDAGGVDGTVVLDTGEDEADEAVQRAVDAYKRNDWDAAQHALDDARALGADDDENVDRLQSNLDALFTEDTSTPDDSATRRVRDLANAKTSSLQVVQEQKLDEAKDAEAAGDLERASSLYGEVADLAKNIGVTEQKESAEQRTVLEEAQKAQAKTESKKKAKREAEKTAAPDEIDVDGLEIEGGVEGGVVGGVLGGEAAPEQGLGGLGTKGTGPGGGGSGYGAGGGSTSSETTANEPVPVVEAPPAETKPAAEPEPVVVEAELQSYESVAARAPGASRKPSPKADHVARAGKGRAARDVAGTPMFEPEAPPPPPAPPPSGRAALEVQASPYTVALPLAGATVRHEAALLPADAFPTLTVRYRTGVAP